jgi:hypothetical protein
MFLFVNNNPGILFIAGELIETIRKEVGRLVSYITRQVELESPINAAN